MDKKHYSFSGQKAYSCRFLFLLILLSLCSFNFLSAEWISLTGGNEGMKSSIIKSTRNSTVVELTLSGYQADELEINEGKYLFLSAPGTVWLMEKGLPQLPSARNSLIIGDRDAVSLRVISQETETQSTLPVAPSKGHFTRDIDPESVPYTFNSFYDKDEWYPKETVFLDHPYVVRDLRGITLQFNPFQYNNARRELKICKRMVIEIFRDPDKLPENELIRNKAFRGITREFEDVYRTLFANYGEGDFKYTPIPEPGRLLIVYPQKYSQQVIPFYQWKLQRGIPALMAEYPTQTGTGTSALKSYIQNLYNSSEGLTYIIFIGEAADIPTLNGQYESAPSDPCYVKLSGTDAYPDAYISRISVTSQANLVYVLKKIIRYEKTPDQGAAAAWYLKGVGVASSESGSSGIPDYQRANLLRDMLLGYMFTSVDQIYDPGATIAQVKTALNAGRSILNYIGHGSGTSWGTTGFSVTNVHELSNGYKNPFIFDVACQNGDFTRTECLEEAWLRAGDTLNPKGAIAAYGSSTNASWVPPCDMQNHAIKLLTTKQRKTVGGVCFNGLMHGMDLWGGSSGEGLKMMEQFNIFGDCTLMLTFGIIPDTIAPARITDLAAVEPTSNSIKLNWTSPQDSSIGGIVSYNIRYSTSIIQNDDDFNAAQSVVLSGLPDSSGMLKNYKVQGLTPGTSYYFAIKAKDIWGNASVLSNVLNTQTLAAPVIACSPDSLILNLGVGAEIHDTLLISNSCSSLSTLDYQVQMINSTFPTEVILKSIPVEKNIEAQVKDDKENPVKEYGMSFKGSGGPDAFGYKWIDSDAPQGPQFAWNDISQTGTPAVWVATGTLSATDEGKCGPLALGFNFRFYGRTYSNIWLNSNGFISFADITSTSNYTNATIPASSLPNSIIAPLWDDMDGAKNGGTGRVYYKNEGSRFIVQYTDWPRYSTSSAGVYTYQVVIYQSGKILCYYKSITGISNDASVGIEDHNGLVGLQVVKNAPYLKNNLALKFAAEPDWLSVSSQGGTLYNNNTAKIALGISTEGLELGNYSMDILITSNDPMKDSMIIPVKLRVKATPVELTGFSASYSDKAVTLKWETKTEKNNQGFSIQRREKAEKEWSEIAFIKGNGTTTEICRYTFTDKTAGSGPQFYRLKQVDHNGMCSYSRELAVNPDIPLNFELSQNYPNPFNPVTVIKFSLPEASDVRLTVYNALGQKVKELVNAHMEAGYQKVEFRADDLSSGVYIYRIEAGKNIAVKKMSLLR